MVRREMPSDSHITLRDYMGPTHLVITPYLINIHLHIYSINNMGLNVPSLCTRRMIHLSSCQLATFIFYTIVFSSQIDKLADSKDGISLFVECFHKILKIEKLAWLLFSFQCWFCLCLDQLEFSFCSNDYSNNQ